MVLLHMHQRQELELSSAHSGMILIPFVWTQVQAHYWTGHSLFSNQVAQMPIPPALPSLPLPSLRSVAMAPLQQGQLLTLSWRPARSCWRTKALQLLSFNLWCGS